MRPKELIFILLYSAGCWLFWPSVSFESSDGNWADREIQLKERDFESMVYFFSLYKLMCHAEDATLYRTTDKQIWNIFYWPSYFTERKWVVPFKEPSPKIRGGVYPDITATHCFNHPRSESIVNMAIDNSKAYVEALKEQ